jgi:hypothetical protein
MACGCCEDADLGKKLEVARVTPELLHVHVPVELHPAIAPHPITRINRSDVYSNAQAPLDTVHHLS